MEKIIEFLESQQGKNLIAIAISIIVIFIISSFAKRLITKYIQETSSRYKSRRIINFLSYFLIIVVIITMFSNRLTGLTIFLGAAGAGITFALQEVIVSFAGFLAISFSNFYAVGDRVKFGGIKGDIIDVGLLRTSLMEIGDWVSGDLYNGKIVRVANSFIFKEPVYNYSGEFPFLWDEVIVPIKTEGDFQYAKKVFTEILAEVQGGYATEARIYWKKLTEKLMVEKAQVEPMVHFTFNENWITFTLRYVVDYKKRRMTKDIISTKVLTAIRESNGRIAVASSAFEITAFPKSFLNT